MSRYAIGFNGHARICDCLRCAQDRAKDYLQAHMNSNQFASVDPDKPCYVRAHFRKSPRMWKSMPQSKEVLVRMLRGLGAAGMRRVQTERKLRSGT